MDNRLKMKEVKTDIELQEFWKLFKDYITELSENSTYGEELDKNHFFSSEYKNMIEKLNTREKNPLKLLFFKLQEEVIGFMMYCTYFDEDGKSLLAEFYICPEMRNSGYGRRAYRMAEAQIIREGASYIELTPTNSINERFWEREGFARTNDLDEDGKNFYRKLFS
ncbi:MAG: GNAT family N-acetyltransferase [Bacillota bacterium]